MESYQFPSTYTAISVLLDDVDNSKQWNFELWHYCMKATIYIYIYIYTTHSPIPVSEAVEKIFIISPRDSLTPTYFGKFCYSIKYFSFLLSDIMFLLSLSCSYYDIVLFSWGQFLGLGTSKKLHFLLSHFFYFYFFFILFSSIRNLQWERNPWDVGNRRFPLNFCK